MAKKKKYYYVSDGHPFSRTVMDAKHAAAAKAKGGKRVRVVPKK